eukprot:Anaeramoba_ignava/a101622_8.p1 GENE.a101622_8~~a101622_8.p1  ORF type:complete len:134 (+),score=7.11 a101622_8:204-605(+)
MDSLRVCIGSNDGENIAASHLGDTADFHIYDITKSLGAVFVEKRKNTAKEAEHSKLSKMEMIMLILEDVDVFTARKNSPNFKRLAASTKHQPVVVKVDKIEDVLESLLTNFDTISALVKARQQENSFEDILEI